MNTNQEIINTYFKNLKAMGYIYQKTPMGFELNKGPNKFSVITTGDIYDTFYNKKNGTRYELQDRLLGQIMLVKSLSWIFNKARERN